MAGGDVGHGSRGWRPRQPRDGKRKFLFLDSFEEGILSRTLKETLPITPQEVILWSFIRTLKSFTYTESIYLFVLETSTTAYFIAPPKHISGNAIASSLLQLP